jgi:hypothetical protein
VGPYKDRGVPLQIKNRELAPPCGNIENRQVDTILTKPLGRSAGSVALGVANFEGTRGLGINSLSHLLKLFSPFTYRLVFTSVWLDG